MSAFVLAVVLKEADWRVGCAVVAVSVAAWSAAAPPVAGTALGLIGWLLVTGFDVVKNGGLTINGTPDLARLGTLVGVGLVASLVGGRLIARREHGPGDSPVHRPLVVGRPRGVVDGEPNDPGSDRARTMATGAAARRSERR